MDWQEIRQTHPHQWLLVEALEARSENDRRIVEQMSVVEPVCGLPAAWHAI